MIRTLVAADSPLDRAGLGGLLRDAPPDQIEVVGESALAESRRFVAELAPDVLVELRENGGAPVALATVSLVEDPAAAWSARASAAPGDGFAILARDADADEIYAAVVAVAAGLAVVQPRSLLQATGPGNFQSGPERLSPREVDVLGELARGSGNKQIAMRLGISEHTVKFHVGSIFAKLGVSSRTEAVTQGVRLGLIML